MQDSNISTGTILFLVVAFVFRTQCRFLIIAITLPPINKLWWWGSTSSCCSQLL